MFPVLLLLCVGIAGVWASIPSNVVLATAIAKFTERELQNANVRALNLKSITSTFILQHNALRFVPYIYVLLQEIIFSCKSREGSGRNSGHMCEKLDDNG